LVVRKKFAVADRPAAGRMLRIWMQADVEPIKAFQCRGAYKLVLPPTPRRTAGTSAVVAIQTGPKHNIVQTPKRVT
jgi:hypothetical protein